MMHHQQRQPGLSAASTATTSTATSSDETPSSRLRAPRRQPPPPPKGPTRGVTTIDSVPSTPSADHDASPTYPSNFMLSAATVHTAPVSSSRATVTTASNPSAPMMLPPPAVSLSPLPSELALFSPAVTAVTAADWGEELSWSTTDTDVIPVFEASSSGADFDDDEAEM